MTKLDFGNDELGQALSEHCRLEERFPGIYVGLPHNSMVSDVKQMGDPRGAYGQTQLWVQAARRGAELGFWRTVMWDGISNQAHALTRFVGRIGIYADATTKSVKMKLGELLLANDPSVNWRNNGWAQGVMYNTVRDGLLTAPEPFHVWMIGHSVAKDEDGIIGMDAGGPASASKFSGGQFSVYLSMIRNKQGRFLVVDDYLRGANRIDVAVKLPPGTHLEGTDPSGALIPIPDDDFEASVAIHHELMLKLGLRWMRGGIHADKNVGKSTFASAFLGLPDTKPCLVIMSDNQGDLPTWWPEVKQATASNQKP